jgi:hypothetical protein
MSPCRRRVLIVFGGLFLAAVFFVPFRSMRVSLDRDTRTNLVWRRTFYDGGYMFFLRFLRRYGERREDSGDPDVRYALLRAQNVVSVRCDLDVFRLILELSIIGLLAGYNYFVFCGLRRRRGDGGSGDLER